MKNSIFKFHFILLPIILAGCNPFAPADRLTKAESAPEEARLESAKQGEPAGLRGKSPDEKANDYFANVNDLSEPPAPPEAVNPSISQRDLAPEAVAQNPPASGNLLADGELVEHGEGTACDKYEVRPEEFYAELAQEKHDYPKLIENMPPEEILESLLENDSILSMSPQSGAEKSTIAMQIERFRLEVSGQCKLKNRPEIKGPENRCPGVTDAQMDNTLFYHLAKDQPAEARASDAVATTPKSSSKSYYAQGWEYLQRNQPFCQIGPDSCSKPVIDIAELRRQAISLMNQRLEIDGQLMKRCEAWLKTLPPETPFNGFKKVKHKSTF